MSSRILGPGEPVEASPIVWRRLSSDVAQPPESLPEGAVRLPETHLEGTGEQDHAAEEPASAHPSDPPPPSASFLQALNCLVREPAAARTRFRIEAEADTVALAVAIARRILHKELSTDPEAILSLVKTAFEKLNAQETHRLRVSPSNAAEIERNRAGLDLPEGFEVVPDGSLDDGAVQFETTRGNVDASIDTQLNEIVRGFAAITARRNK
jgi:flagellar biosynthesis/type III secretory pathway protein FliH